MALDWDVRNGLRRAAVGIGIVAAVFSVATGPAVGEESLEASEIVDRAIEKNSFEFESGRSEMKLVVVGDDGSRSEKQMVVKAGEVGGDARTLVELRHPDDLKDQAFLFARNEEGEDDIWMYVPALEVTRRIKGSDKQGAFLGSHFTYADLESRDAARATYEKRGGDEVGGHAVHVIEATPEPALDSEYGSIEMYVRKSDYVPLKFIFRDDSGEIMKRLLVTRVGTTESGEKYLKQMKMKSSGGGYSVVTVESIDSGADPPDSTFSRAQLGE